MLVYLATGVSWNGSWPSWAARSTTSGIVLTHGDSDHIGFAEQLRQEKGILVRVHELDAARARGEVKKPNSGWGPIKVRPLLRFLWYSGRHGGLRIRPLREVMTFGDGDVLDLPGSPRHPRSGAYTRERRGPRPGGGRVVRWRRHDDWNVLTGERGPRPAPFTLDPGAALASLARLEAVQATWVLPGHGEPWRGGVAEAIRQVRQVATGA